MVDKVERDGLVAVLVSSGYGAGWSTWGSKENCEQMMFCPALVHAVERGVDWEELESIAKSEFPDEYLGGLDGLGIVWVTKGTRFYIHEYDGDEDVRCVDTISYTA